MARIWAAAFLIAPLGFLIGAPPVAAQDEAQRIRFAPPERLQAGTKFLGAKRLYPSPSFHDVNGDGTLDIVIGDLWGRVTYSLGSASESGVTFGKEAKLLDKDGGPLKFDNW